MKNESIYIVLSQTGTMLSRLLKFFTGAEFNHASIATNVSLNKMYSFGRINAYNPFVGGFVEEGRNTGTFKRFYKTKALVLKVDIDRATYLKIEQMLKYFTNNKTKFSYNYLGLFLAFFNKDYSPHNRYYCSQFVRACLASFNIENARTLPKVIKPIDFLKLTNSKVIYKGSLKNYALV